jgi:hypothetical protein
MKKVIKYATGILVSLVTISTIQSLPEIYKDAPWLFTAIAWILDFGVLFTYLELFDHVTTED